MYSCVHKHECIHEWGVGVCVSIGKAKELKEIHKNIFFIPVFETIFFFFVIDFFIFLFSLTLQSHSFHEAHWDGSCALPPEVQHAFQLRKLTDSSEETLSEGLQDLSTS